MFFRPKDDAHLPEKRLFEMSRMMRCAGRHATRQGWCSRRLSANDQLTTDVIPRNGFAHFRHGRACPAIHCISYLCCNRTWMPGRARA